MRRLHIGLLAFMAVLAHPLPSAINEAVRTTGGLVSGVPGSDPAVTVFKGIPYAAPPVGDLRWRPPQPPPAWQGVRKAAEFSPSCIQLIVEERKPWTYEFMTHNQISEDCLYLNVWTPAKSAAERLPVFFWIHGGGNVEGSAAVPIYDGEALARRGVVVVTINYRLGVFGFLAHPELSAESGRGVSGNYGTLDQIAALRWVHENIAAFGGDPNRIAIAGQSAGSRGVHNLMVSPLARGLFQRAIAQSGSGIVPNNRALRLAATEQQGVKFAESKGARSIKELRAMPWEKVEAGTRVGSTSSFQPVIDGWVIPDDHNAIFRAGKQNDVPVLTGLTADEQSSQPNYGTIPLEEFRKQVEQRFGDLAATFFKLYPFSNQAEAGEAQKASARDQGLVSMYLWAAQRAKTAKTEAYTYYWTHTMPGPDAARYGAFHTSEVPYVFNTLNKSMRPWTEEDRRIAQMLGSYWVNFIATGNPNGAGLPVWPAFREDAAVTMEIGDRFAPRPVADKAKIDFFRVYFDRPDATAR